MPWANRVGSGTGSRLFLAYALASLVPVLVLGVVLAGTQQRAGESWALTQGQEKAAVIEQTAIAPALGGDDLTGGLSKAELASVQQATDLAVFSGSVTRLRLRDFNGRVVFSDDGSLGDQLPSTDPAFQAATDGSSNARLVADPSGASGQVIRVLEPVVPNSSGQATGVLEIYLPYAQIKATTTHRLHATYALLGIGLGLLYAVLALISWSTTRRLRAHAAQRHHEALHDSLTGLANRELFRLTAEAEVAREPGALVLVDLDHFKAVNDTLGHHAGDVLLKSVAQRLSENLRTDDLVARLGGDEFGILLPGLTDETAAVELLRGIRSALNEDVSIGEAVVRPEASFGVALFPAHGSSLEQLLQRADSAMYEGKRGRDGIVVYRSGAPAGKDRGRSLKTELTRAIAGNEFVLHYLPRYDLRTGQPNGMEALIRWQHPVHGLLAPKDFLPAAEESGLIEQLTEWVLRRALRDREDWRATGADWPVSVNLSGRCLRAGGFVERLRALLLDADADPQALTLEVAESALTGDAHSERAALRELSALGIRVAIDDFGTGHTSLGQLRPIGVHEIKIDRSFIGELSASEKDQAVARAIIGMAHGLGAEVTAEGVEDSAAAAWLRAAGCDAAQGYHFAQPAPWPNHSRPIPIETASVT